MNSSNLPKWQTTASKCVVNDEWLKLRADTCLTSDGKTLGPWYVMEYGDWINCVAVDSENNVAILRHYRHGINDYVHEIVAGRVDPREAPEISMKRELYEEIGYEGGVLHQTGIAYANPSSQNNKICSFLAIGGNFSKSTYKEDGADFLIEKHSFADFAKQVSDPKSSTLYQSFHLASIFFAFNFIRSSDGEGLADLRKQLAAL